MAEYVSHYNPLCRFMIDRLLDCEARLFLMEKLCKAALNIFSILRYHSYPFISLWLCVSHVHLMFFYCAWIRSQSSVRRCGLPTPYGQGNVRHYPLQIFQIKTITTSFTCGVNTSIPFRLFVCYSKCHACKPS